MKHLKQALFTLFTALAASAALAQAIAPLTEGEVRKVDKESGKLTIKHGEIKNLEMPPMTMVFRASDPRLLESLNAGDQINFHAEKVDGQFTVTAIEKRLK
jgi:Cu(I)/Ag(I) efflux system periplasmic protein CusF